MLAGTGCQHPIQHHMVTCPIVKQLCFSAFISVTMAPTSPRMYAQQRPATSTMTVQVTRSKMFLKCSLPLWLGKQAGRVQLPVSR